MDSPFRFLTLSARLRRWVNLDHLNESSKTDGASLKSVAVAIPADSPSQAVGALNEKSEASIWLRPPDRWRFDLLKDGRTFRQVVDGDRWLLDNPWQGVERGKGPGDHGQRESLLRVPPLVYMWSPDAFLLPYVRLDPLGTTEYLGRRCSILNALPVEESTEFPERVWQGVADEYQLLLDDERRTLLKLVAAVGGRPFAVDELVYIEFDSQIDDGVFAT